MAFIDSDTNIYAVYLNVTGVLYAFIAVPCIFAILYTNSYIFSETQRQKKRFKTEQLPHGEAEQIKKDSKATNILVIPLGALILTYVPIIITCVLNVLWRWASSSVLLNSLFKPTIYCWRTKKLRQAFLEILHQ